MELSVDLPDEELAVLDAYVRDQGLTSRSAGLLRAVQMLRHPALEQDYAAAWQEWADQDTGGAWDAGTP